MPILIQCPTILGQLLRVLLAQYFAGPKVENNVNKALKSIKNDVINPMPPFRLFSLLQESLQSKAASAFSKQHDLNILQFICIHAPLFYCSFTVNLSLCKANSLQWKQLNVLFFFIIHALLDGQFDQELPPACKSLDVDSLYLSLAPC